jgi:hypothetical protein
VLTGSLTFNSLLGVVYLLGWVKLSGGIFKILWRNEGSCRHILVGLRFSCDWKEANLNIIHIFKASTGDMEHENKYEKAVLPRRRQCC